MIEEVVSIELPVHERMVIKKNRLTPKDYAGESVPRISIFIVSSQIRDSFCDVFIPNLASSNSFRSLFIPFSISLIAPWYSMYSLLKVK